MMVALLIAGIGFLLAGLLGIGFGIPVKEFSFGNTLIVTGVVAACTGMIMLGLWMVVRELKNIARQLGSGVADDIARGNSARSREPPRRAIRLRKATVSRSAATSRSRQAQAMRNRQRTIRAVAAAMAGRGRGARPRAQRCAAAEPPKPRRPSSRGATCCFLRHRGRNASAPRRERPIRPRPMFASRPPAAPPPLKPSEAAAGDIRRRLAAIGTLADRRCAIAAAQRPRALDVYRAERRRDRRGSLSAGGAKRGTAAGDGSQIGRRRWHGLFVVFRRLDRGANARRHDAVRLDR